MPYTLRGDCLLQIASGVKREAAAAVAAGATALIIPAVATNTFSSQLETTKVGTPDIIPHKGIPGCSVKPFH